MPVMPAAVAICITLSPGWPLTRCSRPSGNWKTTSGMVSRCDQAQRQRLERTQRVVETTRRRAGQLDPLRAPCKSRQDDLALESCHGLSDAAMDARAERHMAARTSFDVVAVGIRPLAWVPVRGRERPQHLGVLLRSKPR